MNNRLPFGLLFQEHSIQKDSHLTPPHYDSNEGVSYTIDDNGNRIPYIELINLNLGTSTGTNTKDLFDPTDTDPGDDQ